MTTRNRRVEYILAVDDQASARLQRIEREFLDVDRAADRVNDTGKRMGGSGGMAGGLNAVGTALAAIGAFNAGQEVFRQFVEFERGLGLVATLSDEAAAAVPRLESEIRDLSVESGKSLGDLVAAEFDVVSATGDVANSMEVLRAATDLAIAGGTDVATTADGITTVLNAFSLSGDRSRDVANALFESMQFGKVTVEQLAGSLGAVAPSARSANVTMEDLLGSVGAVARVLGGSQIRVGSTSVARLFDAVAVASDDVIERSREMGREVGLNGFEFSKAAIEAKGLGEFLRELSIVVDSDQRRLSALGVSVEAAKGAMVLLKDEAREANEAIANQTDAVSELAKGVERMEETASAKLERARANFVALGDAILNLPVVKDIGLGDVIAAAPTAPSVLAELDDDVDDLIESIDRLDRAPSPSILRELEEFRAGPELDIATRRLNALRDRVAEAVEQQRRLRELNAEPVSLDGLTPAEGFTPLRDGGGIPDAFAPPDDFDAFAAEQRRKEFDANRAAEADELAAKAEFLGDIEAQRSAAELDILRTEQGTQAARRAAVELDLAGLEDLWSDHADVVAAIERLRVAEIAAIDAEASAETRRRAEGEANARARAAKAEAERDASRRQDFHEAQAENAERALFELGLVGLDARAAEVAQINRHYDDLIEDALEYGAETVDIERARQAELAGVRQRATEDEQRDGSRTGAGGMADAIIEDLSADRQAARAVRDLHGATSDLFVDLADDSVTAGDALDAFKDRFLRNLAEMEAEALSANLIGALMGSPAAGNAAGPLSSGLGALAGALFGGGGSGGDVASFGGSTAQATAANPYGFDLLAGGGAAAVDISSAARDPVAAPVTVQQSITIQAHDASGFDRLLAERAGFFREQAKAGVSDAMNRDSRFRNQVRQTASGRG